jgi:hypothetical protein
MGFNPAIALTATGGEDAVFLFLKEKKNLLFRKKKKQKDFCSCAVSANYAAAG